MSLHDILMERAALQHPEFRKDYGKGAPSTALDNLSELALYSAKLAQAQIAEEQKAEQQRIAKAKNTEQLLKMPIPENTDAETIMSIGDGGIDVKRVLKPKDSAGGTKGVYIVDKETGALKKSGEVEKSAEVFSSFMSPELSAERKYQSGLADIKIKQTALADKLTVAIKRMDIVRKQFDEALPESSDMPLYQRIGGGTEVWLTKMGVKDNSKLMAIESNQRMLAIQMIRMFGEVGNLSETEQESALQSVNMSGLTPKERVEKVRQIAEVALAGAPEYAIRTLLERKDIVEMLDAYSIDLGQGASGGSNAEQNDELVNAYMKKYPNRTREDILRAMSKPRGVK
jgi:hypothetical protein